MGGSCRIIARVSPQPAPGCTHKAGFKRPPFSLLLAAAAHACLGHPLSARAASSAAPAAQVGKASRPRHRSNDVTLSPGPSRPFPHGGRRGLRRRLLMLTGSGLTQRGGSGAARGAAAGPIAGGCVRRRPGLLPFLSRARRGRRRAQVRAARGAVRPGPARRGGGRKKGRGRSRPRLGR